MNERMMVLLRDGVARITVTPSALGELRLSWKSRLGGRWRRGWLPGECLQISACLCSSRNHYWWVAPLSSGRTCEHPSQPVWSQAVPSSLGSESLRSVPSVPSQCLVPNRDAVNTVNTQARASWAVQLDTLMCDLVSKRQLKSYLVTDVFQRSLNTVLRFWWLRRNANSSNDVLLFS